MTAKEKFILKFIKQFYQKSQKKRRSSKNHAHYIARTINNVCRLYFDRKLQFDEKEIFWAFQKNNFSLMESCEAGFTWERRLEGHPLISSDLFININPQSNHDLKLVMKRSYAPNFKPETVERIDNLKMQLNNFWQENQEKISKY